VKVTSDMVRKLAGAGAGERRVARWVAVVAVLATILATIAVAVWGASTEWSKRGNGSEEQSMPVAGGTVSDITADELAKVSRTRVFFGHQSVGMNVLDVVPAVFSRHGVPAPPIAEGAATPGPGGGFVDHAFIGANEQPLSKIKAFDAAIRGGLGQQVDVAMMKLCYIDVNAGTDVEALFAAYRDTMAALERDFPNVTFVKVTVPVTTDRGLAGRMVAGVKRNLLGRRDRMGPDENAARERLNGLIRGAYGDHLFDLAALESTVPDGSRVSGEYGGERYFALYPGYAADEGHLNAEGGRVVATAWLRAVAAASSK
jgi:hypothetical protein